MTDLVGQWRLLGWRRLAGDGTVSYPLGENAAGLLIYTADGLMMVQIEAAGRPKLNIGDPLGGTTDQRAAAYSTYLAYFGSYQVRGTEVVHRIDGSSFPDWTATVADRPFERQGHELVLRTPPAEIGGKTVVNEIAWVRAPHAGGAPHPIPPP